MSDRQPGPYDEEFERGYIPADEPPGLEEQEYAAWKAAGGQVIRHQWERCQGCQQGVFDGTRAEYHAECEEPSVWRVRWKQEGWLYLCQRHAEEFERGLRD
jgi:hypothetical protein